MTMETEEQRTTAAITTLANTASHDGIAHDVLHACLEDLGDADKERRTLGLDRARALTRAIAEKCDDERADSQRRIANADTLGEILDGQANMLHGSTLAQVQGIIERAVREVEESGTGRPLRPVLVAILAAHAPRGVSRARVHQCAYLTDRGGARLGVGYHYDREDGGPAADLTGEALTSAEIARVVVGRSQKGRGGQWSTHYTLGPGAAEPERVGLWNLSHAEPRLRALARASDETITCAACIRFERDRGLDGEAAIDRVRTQRPWLTEEPLVSDATRLLETIGAAD